MDRKLARRNIQFGVAMFVLMIAMVVGAFAYAYIYLANV